MRLILGCERRALTVSIQGLLCAAFLEDDEVLHVGCYLGIARALGGEVRCRVDAVALEPHERLGEPFELREVAELNGGACKLCDFTFTCIREMPPCRPPSEKPHMSDARP